MAEERKKQVAILTDEQVDALLALAGQHDGHCDRCGRIIRIYKYPVNKQMLTVLQSMRQAVEDTGINEVNFNQLDLPYRLGSQRTKMRLHGLIKQVTSDGEKVANTWLITRKGGAFLSGEPIPKTVIVFDNQNLGYEDGMITMHRLMDDADYHQEAVSSSEAEVYKDVRTPQVNMSVRAEFRGHTTSSYTKGRLYDLEIERLQLGKPVKVVVVDGKNVILSYPTIAWFYKNWRIAK